MVLCSVGVDYCPHPGSLPLPTLDVLYCKTTVLCTGYGAVPISCTPSRLVEALLSLTPHDTTRMLPVWLFEGVGIDVDAPSMPA